MIQTGFARVAVRYAPADLLTSRAPSSLLEKPLFRILGAPNVILETIKRGEDDFFDRDQPANSSETPQTIVLRIYESFGGHARAFLRISGALGISKAYETNILEDEVGEDETVKTLDVTHDVTDEKGKEGEGDVEIKLDFRGFEVKTVKLILGGGASGGAE